MSIPVFKPSLKRKEMENVLSCMVTDQIGPSTLSEQLIEAVSHDLNLQGGVALREYVRAVSLAVDSLELCKGDEAIVSPLAPSIYYTELISRGISVKLADVNPENATISIESVESLITENTKALFVHYPFGFVPDMSALSEFNIPLVEDISEGLGSECDDIKAGSWGKFVILAMEPRHIITSGGGALLLAKDDESLKVLHDKADYFPADVHLSDLNASLGLIQYQTLDSYIEKRHDIAKLFIQSAQKGRHKTFISNERFKPVWQSFPLILENGVKEVRNYCLRKGIETHLAFAESSAERIDKESRSSNISKLMLSTLIFPLYPVLGKQNIEQISKVLSTLP